MTVLIISAMHDVHTQAVMPALAAMGVKAEVLDLSEFPTRLSVVMEFGAGGHRMRLTRAGSGGLDLSSVTAVWWRRPQPFGLPVSVADPVHRRFAASEAATAIQGIFPGH